MILLVQDYEIIVMILNMILILKIQTEHLLHTPFQLGTEIRQLILPAVKRGISGSLKKEIQFFDLEKCALFHR